MKVDNVYDIFGGILIVALVAVILAKPNTAKDVTATGSAFSNSLSVAQKG